MVKVAGPLLISLVVWIALRVKLLSSVLLIVIGCVAVADEQLAPPAETPNKDDLAFWEELAFWEAVKDSQNPAELEAYLKSYPDGRFAPLARIRIQALRDTPPEEEIDKPPAGTVKPPSSTSSSELSAVPPPTTIDTQDSGVFYIALRTSNIRGTPSTRAAKVGLLREGERIRVTGEARGGMWYRVQLENGQIGYVYATLLQKDATSAAESPSSSQLATIRQPEVTDQSTITIQPLPAGVKAGDVFRDCPECPQMVVIPPGQFSMGSDSHRSEEKPARLVIIAQPFAMGMYEVSNSEWDACVREGGCSHSAKGRDVGNDDQLPVSNISWDDAQQFVRWLGNKTGEDYRLPSEAEWEYAARGGTNSIYWWGNRPGNNRANCKGCASAWDNQQAAPVGAFEPNPFGLHDIHGNVWEWTADCWNSSYQGAPSDGSEWVRGDCLARVLRGGAWRLGPEYMRVSRRSKYDRDVRYYLHGFRVAKTLR